MSHTYQQVAKTAWDEEVVRRIAQLDTGEVETVPAEQVFAELRARLIDKCKTGGPQHDQLFP